MRRAVLLAILSGQPQTRSAEFAVLRRERVTLGEEIVEVAVIALLYRQHGAGPDLLLEAEYWFAPTLGLSLRTSERYLQDGQPAGESQRGAEAVVRP